MSGLLVLFAFLALALLILVPAVARAGHLPKTASASTVERYQPIYKIGIGRVHGMNPTRPIRMVIAFLSVLLISPIATSAVSAETVRAVESLSNVELKQLPPSTKIQFLGKTTTLGALREAHAARQVRFARASALGVSARRILKTRNTSTIAMPASALAPYAKDYQDFCSASKATACLYIPDGRHMITLKTTGDTISTSHNMAFDVDPLITDKSVCASQGGKLGAPSFFKNPWRDHGCYYAYPLSYSRNFITNAPSAKIKMTDSLYFSARYDP